MGLKKKIFYEFSLPLMISILIIISAAYLPFLMSYTKLIDEFINDIAESRKAVFEETGKFVSASSQAYIQISVNGVLLANQAIQMYYNNTLLLKPNFNYEAIPINGKLFETKRLWPRDWIPELKLSRQPEWYLNPDSYITNSLTDESKENLLSGMIGDIILGTQYNNTLCPGYFIGFSDGLTYIGPTRYRNLFDEEIDNMFPNCTSDYFDATCTLWYRDVNDTQQDKVLLTHPYYYMNQMVQEVCLGTYQDGITLRTVCSSFNFNMFYDTYLQQYKGLARKFIVELDGSVIYHPDAAEYAEDISTGDSRYKVIDVGIAEIEFKEHIETDNAQRYIEYIVPAYNETKIKELVYKDYNNTKTLIGIFPINLRLALDRKMEHYYSLGFTTPYSTLEETLQDSKKDVGTLLLYEGVFSYFIVIISSILIYYASAKLSDIIIEPLYDLSHRISVLGYDLDISFSNYEYYNSYEIQLLYILFERLKVMMRLRHLEYFKDPKEAVINYKLSYKQFKVAKNIKGMFYCNYHLGFLSYLRKDYRSAIDLFTNCLELSDLLKLEPRLLFRLRKGLILCYYHLDDMNNFMRILLKSLEIIEFNLNADTWAEWADTILLQCDFMILKGIPVNNYLDLIQNDKEFEHDPVVVQKIYYIKALCYKSEGMFKDAMNMLYKALRKGKVFDPILRVAILSNIQEILAQLQLDWDWPEMYMGSLMDLQIEVKLVCSKNNEISHFSTRLWQALKSYEEIGDSLQMMFIDEEYTMSDRLLWGIQSDDRQAFDELYPLYDKIYDAIHDKQPKSTIKSRSSVCEIIDTNFWLVVVVDRLDEGSSYKLSNIQEQLSHISFNLIIVSRDFDHPIICFEKLASRSYITSNIGIPEISNIVRFIFCSRNPGSLASERALYQSSYYIS